MTDRRMVDCNYYEVLGLPVPGSGLASSQQEIKAAYRHALLRHHPDKGGIAVTDFPQRPANDTNRRNTIDDIVQAYKVLSSRSSRADYDRTLRLQPAQVHRAQAHPHQSPGFERVDLEDMLYDETQASWHRTCRCGDPKGFSVTESELEEESDHGIVLVGCNGCSLFISVTFQAMLGPDDKMEGPKNG
ncbi:MAG: Diphthamide biosynthesis protein 4 [Thelocarpon superellum]|nr:MAG: Diphthamide biosynthesis protein 4 [Thelocarpon superellum]